MRGDSLRTGNEQRARQNESNDENKATMRIKTKTKQLKRQGQQLRLSAWEMFYIPPIANGAMDGAPGRSRSGMTTRKQEHRRPAKKALGIRLALFQGFQFVEGAGPVVAEEP